MATLVVNTAPNYRSSLLRFSVIGGLIIAMLHLTIQAWFVFSFLGQTPFMSVMQYIASGAMGESALEGGLATALLGVVLEFLMTIIIAGIFVLSADRIPRLRRYVVVGSLLYGFGVFIVMNFIVLPLSAAPPVPVSGMEGIEMAAEHILLIGLPLGTLMRWNANTNK
jgi:uncharacterized membrane protein YagU involved in acid resistance